jgi:hypothetical protein
MLNARCVGLLFDHAADKQSIAQIPAFHSSVHPVSRRTARHANDIRPTADTSGDRVKAARKEANRHRSYAAPQLMRFDHLRDKEKPPVRAAT